MTISKRRIAVGLLALAGAALPAAAQVQPGGMAPSAPSTGHPQRDTLLKLSRPITVSFTDQRLEDILLFITQYSGAQIEPLYADDRNPDGLERDRTITVRAENATVLRLIESVLQKASDGFSENTWQMADTGELQIGPKSRLNKFRRVQLYDINDLLLEIPDYDEVPRIDLQSVLQSGQGGGGQSPFNNAGDDDQQDQERRERQERAQEIIDIITQTVEPEQWVDGGGTGGTLRYWQGTIIVNAPDYMHRQVNGYPYWPSRLTRVGMVQNRRYVSLTTDNGISTIDGFENAEATAVVGGKIIRSGDPGGGG